MKKEKNKWFVVACIRSGKQTKQNEPIVWTGKKPSNRANNMKNNLFELPVKLASE